MLDKRLVDAMSRILGRTTEGITPATSQENTGEWDSLGHLRLILEIEAVFGIRFSTAEIPELTSATCLQAALKSRGVC